MSVEGLRCLLVFRSVTPVHAGAGPEAMSAIDLPIQRERHTGWPTIYGSSIKGALRNYYLLKANDEEKVKKVFGSEPGESEKRTGAISFSDARLIIFPVKSYSKVFLWITCLEALNRLISDIKCILGREDVVNNIETEIEEVKRFLKNNPDVDGASPTYSDGIYIEDVKIKVRRLDLLASISEFLSKITGIKKEELEERLIVVRDEIFSDFVRNRSFVVPRIRLDPRTKVNQGSALWYEEYLPPECILYTIVVETIAADDEAKDAVDDFYNKIDDRVINFGGKETIGKGFLHVKVLKEEEI